MMYRAIQAGLYTFLAIVAAVGIVIALGAMRQANSHEGMDALSRFYATWMMPDARHASCCSDKDCYATEAKFRNGQWFAKQRENGEWMAVPPEKVEHERDNPDGRNHVCASPAGYVFCFIVGGGF